MNRARALNLTAALAIVAVAELLLYRMGSQLFLPRSLGTTGRLIFLVGLFVSHLGGVLGVLVAAAALANLFRRGQLFPRSMRLTVGTIALFFLILTGASVLLPIAGRLAVHVKTSQAFLAWLIVLGLWRETTWFRHRLGAALVALPAMLHAAALFGDRAGWQGNIPAELQRAGELAALASLALAPLLITPAPRRQALRAVGLAAAGAMAVAAVAALTGAFDLVETVALYVFRVQLPTLGSVGALAYAALLVAAMTGATLAIAWNLAQPGPPRLVGWGLVLLAVAGPHAVAPTHVLFATCGLLAIAVGLLGQAMRTRHPAAVPAAPTSAAAPVTPG